MPWPRAVIAGGLTLGLAESLTGGLASSRLVNVPGASRWFRGSVVSYASEVKFAVLGVPEGPVVSEEAARAMAEGARRVLESDVGLVHHRGGRSRTAGRQAPRDGVRRPGPGRPPDRVVRVQRARRPGPGPAVRHHRRPRPVAADARVGVRRGRSGPSPRVAVRGRRWSPGRGAAAGVTGMPAGTSSTQVLPGCRVIGAPLAAERVAGWVRLDRLQVPAMATLFRITSRGPEPMAFTCTSNPPSSFSTQGPSDVCTVMITTLAALVCAPSSSVSGDPGVGPLVAGRRVPLPGHVGCRGERDVDAGPRTGNRSRGQRRRVVEDGRRRLVVRRVERPQGGGVDEGGVRRHPPGLLDDGRAPVSRVQVVVDQRGGGEQGDDRIDPAGVDEQRVGQLGEDADVGRPCRPEVADQRSPLALEHGQQPGDGALDRLLEHDVGLVEAGRRPVTGIVADLHPEGGAGGHHPARGRRPGQRAGGHRRSRHARGGCRRRLGLGGLVAPGGEEGAPAPRSAPPPPRRGRTTGCGTGRRSPWTASGAPAGCRRSVLRRLRLRSTPGCPGGGTAAGRPVRERPGSCR